MLTFILGVIDQINAMINTLDQRIETYMTNLEESIGLLHTIPGVSYHIAMGIIAEIGTTMDCFPTHKHLASWAGICPGSNESAGKKRSSKVTHGNKYLKTILVEAAWAASHTKGTVLADTYHRIAKRRGRKRANLALGHKILSATYFILRDRIPYRNPNQNPDVIAQRKAAKIKRLEKQLKKLKIDV